MGDHGLCCDERAEQLDTDCNYITWDENHQDFRMYTWDHGRDVFVAVVDYCPWCGTKLDAGAEGVEPWRDPAKLAEADAVRTRMEAERERVASSDVNPSLKEMALEGLDAQLARGVPEKRPTILTDVELAQAYAKAVNKPVLLVSIPVLDPVSELHKAAPYLADADPQVFVDGQAFIVCDDWAECERLYGQTVGDDGPTATNSYDGPARVSALTIDAAGVLHSENT